MGNVFRVYYYSKATRQELPTPDKARGLPWSGLGGMATDKAGRFIQGTQTVVTYWKGRGPVVRVTTADFSEPVLVKFWAPGMRPEWSELMSNQE